MSLDALLTRALAQRRDSIFHAVSLALRDAKPELALVETDSPMFDIDDFVSSGLCEMREIDGVRNQWDTTWTADHEPMVTSPLQAWLEIRWKEHRLELVHIEIQGSHCREQRNYVLAESEEAAMKFISAVCSWNAEIRGEVLVFSDGHWAKSPSLFESIHKTTLESLILAGKLKEEIVQDFERFFQSKAVYREHGIPWKRGVLFLGPPGNGKTHMVKALVNQLKISCLYVRSFSAEYQTDQRVIGSVFQRARAQAPCVLVLEDLDSLLTDGNRSYFLNELDGFAANEGLLTIASTNHPDRLDPAILERPSRFDRKYTFDLPAMEERRRYLAMFAANIGQRLRISESDVESLALATEGFSFAYLKELFLSSMMEWISQESRSSMAAVMAGQVETLLSQMTTTMDVAEAGEADVNGSGYSAAGYAAQRRRIIEAMYRRRQNR